MRLLPLLCLTACPLPDTDTGKVDDGETTPRQTAPDEGTTPTLEDTDSDHTTEGPCDTGGATAYWIGSFEADGEDFVSGTFGWAYFGARVEDWVCVASGEFRYEGPSAQSCPGCEWSWDLSGLVGSTAVGDHCGSGDIHWREGDLDGLLDYDWAFAERYTYGGAPYELVDAVLVYVDGYGGWFPVAYDRPDAGVEYVYGDAGSLEFLRPVGGFYYYYYSGC
ncbi:MAG: hypothetical protein ACOZNI_26490 [Myxococcota bacterium]